MYNEIIEENKSNFDYIHFIHDDAFVYDTVNSDIRHTLFSKIYGGQIDESNTD